MYGLHGIREYVASMEFLLLFVLLFFILPIWFAFRARRRAREAAEQMQYEASQGRGGGAGGNGPPSIFDLFMGPGMWSRSYEIDPETGEWVDVTDRRVEEPAPEPEKEPEQQRKERVSRARPRASANPLGGLFGGMGVGEIGGQGGGGDFEVQPPDELIDFDDVGGMEGLKRELEESVGLLLKHPDEAERYGIEWNGILLHGPPGEVSVDHGMASLPLYSAAAGACNTVCRRADQRSHRER